MKRCAKRLTAIIIAVIIALSPEVSTISFADSPNNYVCDSTYLGDVSENNTTGYTIGGVLESNGAPNFYVRYVTYANSLGTSDAVTYDEKTPFGTDQNLNDSNLYGSWWSCRVNISEHHNVWGWYTTSIYFVNQDGTTELRGTNSVYVSPITLNYTCKIAETKQIQLSYSYTDASNGSISSARVIDGDQPFSYFENGNGTQIASEDFSLYCDSGTGHFTLWVKDSNGYEKTRSVDITSATSTLELGVAQGDMAASQTPTLNVLATKVANMNGFSWDDDDWDWTSMTATNITGQDNTAPSPNQTEYKYTWSSATSQHTVMSRNIDTDFQSGDIMVTSVWYKATSSNLTGWGPEIVDNFWQNEGQSTLLHDYSTVGDNQWHYDYSQTQSNADLSIGYACDFLRLATSDPNQTIYANDIWWAKVSSVSELVTGVTCRWAYGNQPASYFDNGNGTNLTGTSFQVNKNGPVTVWAKTDDGQEQTRTYTVNNYDQYAGDATPPTGSYNLSTSSWTTDNVTINVTATDTQSGVKSITEPDGTVVSGNTCSYTATDDGTYNFTLTDNAGNTYTYPVTVSNIDRSVSVSYTSSAAYTIDPNNLSSPMAGGEITLTNNNQHIGAQVTLQSLASALSGTNSFTLGAQVEESASGNTTWSEIDNKNVQLAGGSSAVLGVLSPGGTGHIKLVGQLGSLRWPSVAADIGNLQLTFTAVS